MSATINTDELSARYRAQSLRPDSKEILITRFAASDQEDDLSDPPNCGGYGRVRHFRTVRVSAGWIDNPLPIQPARRALNLPASQELRAQVFQNAACNWRCWYCYVPFNLLSADEKRSGWFTAEQLVSLYAKSEDRAPVLDLTGGQPDIVPEWLPWTMDALHEHGLASSVYLWSDDNLSNDYFWRYLTDKDIAKIAAWRNYGRVCCFKGYDATSFAFNTSADAALFERQFELFARFATLGIDLYGYITITTPSLDSVEDAVPRFLDRIQAIDEHLPLRLVPLEVQVYGPVHGRLNTLRNEALSHQYRVLEVLEDNLQKRFSREMRSRNICDVPLRSRAQVK
jgi:uncharacterized Fe-S cluster-containing radical SAM superfamily protein